jgi:hypothetical protein
MRGGDLEFLASAPVTAEVKVTSNPSPLHGKVFLTILFNPLPGGEGVGRALSAGFSTYHQGFHLAPIPVLPVIARLTIERLVAARRAVKLRSLCLCGFGLGFGRSHATPVLSVPPCRRFSGYPSRREACIGARGVLNAVKKSAVPPTMPGQVTLSRARASSTLSGLPGSQSRAHEFGTVSRGKAARSAVCGS